MPAFVTRGCERLCLKWMGEALSFVPSFPLLRWNLHSPIFENSPQPKDGGLRQNHPTVAGNAQCTGNHHLRQWRRHTVRSAVAQSGFIHVASDVLLFFLLGSCNLQAAGSEKIKQARNAILTRAHADCTNIPTTIQALLRGEVGNSGWNKVKELLFDLQCPLSNVCIVRHRINL